MGCKAFLVIYNRYPICDRSEQRSLHLGSLDTQIPRPSPSRFIDIFLTGVQGFEPRNGWTKTSCLTTWRHPIALTFVILTVLSLELSRTFLKKFFFASIAAKKGTRRFFLLPLILFTLDKCECGGSAHPQNW
jgi:hypothetical protein